MYLRRIDGVALSKLDLVPLLQLDELPSNEGIIERICVGRDEASTPINTKTHSLKNHLFLITVLRVQDPDDIF